MNQPLTSNRVCELCGAALTKPQQKQYCGRRCAATSNNIKFPKRRKFDRFCPVCQKRIFKRQVTCSRACQRQYNFAKYAQKIERGERVSPRVLKRYFVERFGPKCMGCGWDRIHPITGICPLQIHHKDGNASNNDLNNLTMICANCHVLTETFGALNMGKGRPERRARYLKKRSCSVMQ